MVGVAVVFFVAYAWRILDTGLSARMAESLNLVTRAVWPVFLADYLFRLYLAEQRWRFVRRHWVDGLAVALPMLRPLRIIGLVRVAQVLDRRLTASLQGRVAGYVTATAALVVFLAGVAVLDAERAAPGASITGFGDALWWAVTTITTAGYGDYAPITGPGRLVAVLLMVAGVALLGVVTAAVAAWFVGRVTDAAREAGAATEATLLAEVAAVGAEVRSLRAELAAVRQLSPHPHPVRPPSPPSAPAWPATPGHHRDPA